MQPGNRGARATVRKLGKSGGERETCGGPDLVSGGIASEAESEGAKRAGGDQEQSGAREQAGKQGSPERGGWEPDLGTADPPDRERLAQASAEILTALHAAKQELAKELEANLKQLKTVLEETQRIQRQMEAVLSEAKATESLKERAVGGDQRPRQEERNADAKQSSDKGDGKRAAQGNDGAQSGGGNQSERWEPNPNNQGSGAAAKTGANGQQQGGAQAQPDAGAGQGAPAWEQLTVKPGEPPTWEPPGFADNASGNPPPWQPPPAANQQNAQQQ